MYIHSYEFCRFKNSHLVYNIQCVCVYTHCTNQWHHEWRATTVPCQCKMWWKWWVSSSDQSSSQHILRTHTTTSNRSNCSHVTKSTEASHECTCIRKLFEKVRKATASKADLFTLFLSFDREQWYNTWRIGIVRCKSLLAVIDVQWQGFHRLFFWTCSRW